MDKYVRVLNANRTVANDELANLVEEIATASDHLNRLRERARELKTKIDSIDSMLQMHTELGFGDDESTDTPR